MREKLLVFTSTFPRWKNDTLPPFVYELSKRLTRDFEVYVLAPGYPGAKSYEEMDGMKIYRFRYFFKKFEKLAGNGGIMPQLKKNKSNYFLVPFFLLGEFIALKRLIRKIKPDVIHSHWIIPQGFITALAIKNIPFIVTSHGSDILGLKGFLGLKRKCLDKAKKITVVSSAIKQEILENIDSGLEDKISVIPMGVDSSLFNPNKKDISIKKKYKINGPFLLFVGRLAPEKGINYLIDAMPKVLEKNPEAKLLIIGEGTLEEELKGNVKKLKILDNVLFLGKMQNKNLPRYYATADLFICPSLREGFGLTFVEAGMCGCKLIGTNIGGIPEIITDKKIGILVKDKSSKELALAINKEIDNKVNLNSIRILRDRFDWGSIVRKYLGELR